MESSEIRQVKSLPGGKRVQYGWIGGSTYSAGDTDLILGWEDPLEEGMTTHSSILAWRIQWSKESGGLWAIGSQRVRHNWSSLAHKHWNTFLNKCGYVIHHFNMHFLLYFIVFANDLLLAVYFIFILDHRNDVSKLEQVFYSHSKWVIAAETTCNINNTSGPGTTNKCMVQWCFKEFCKGDESPEYEKHSG